MSEAVYEVMTFDDRIEIKCKNGTGVFGKKRMNLERLRKTYPRLDFYTLKQVHSNRVVECQSASLEADGHYSDKPSSACLVQTADCLPIILLGEGVSLGVHAGWRGIEQNIIKSAAETLKSKSLDPLSFFVFIGPHIKRDSFEVGLDIANRLIQSTPIEFRDEKKITFSHPHRDKRFVDLDYIALSQLQAAGFDPSKVWISDADTTKDLDYHSYRRDKTPGRQWSFGFGIESIAFLK